MIKFFKIPIIAVLFFIFSTIYALPVQALECISCIDTDESGLLIVSESLCRNALQGAEGDRYRGVKRFGGTFLNCSYTCISCRNTDASDPSITNESACETVLRSRDGYEYTGVKRFGDTTHECVTPYTCISCRDRDESNIGLTTTLEACETVLREKEGYEFRGVKQFGSTTYECNASYTCISCNDADVSNIGITTTQEACETILKRDEGINYKGVKQFGATHYDCVSAPTPPALPAAPYVYEVTPPKLQIPLPTLPGLTEFMPVELQGEAPDRYLLIPWIGQYIAAIYKYAIGITGILAAIMIVIAGAIWLTAGGSAERVSTARSLIEGAMVGLVIALTSYLLLYAINPKLTEFESLKVKFIERVPPEGEHGGMEARGEISSGGPGSAQAFRAISCDGLAQSGEEFEAFFTSYYVPMPYGNPAGYNGIASTIAGVSLNDSLKDFFCSVAMECSCPKGTTNSYKCYAKSGVFAKGGARDGWWPCKDFAEGEKYCGVGDRLPDGQLRYRPGETVAADCNCTTHRSGNCKIEVTLRDGSKKILQVTDTGSGIRGRRFDYFTTHGGEKLSGVFKVKFLPGCQPAGQYGVSRGSACGWSPPPPGPLGPQ